MNLQMLNENPFRPDEPIREPSRFFGRKSEITNTINCIRRGQCVAIVGAGKIGKTSLLCQVFHSTVLREHGLRTEEYCFVLIDGRILAGANCQQSFCHIFEQVLPDQAGEASGLARPFAELQRICRSLRRSDIRLVLVLDSLDAAGSNSQLGSAFFDPLRSLNAQYDVLYLTASESPIHEIASKATGELGSPFFNIFKEFKIGPLRPEESLEMLHAYLHPVYGDCFDNVLAHIVERTVGHPHRLQCVGRQLVEQWRMNGEKWDESCKEAFLRDLEGPELL